MSDDSKAEAALCIEDAARMERDAANCARIAEEWWNLPNGEFRTSARTLREQADRKARHARALRCYAAVLDPGDDALAEIKHEGCVIETLGALRTIAAAAPATPEPAT